VKYFFTIILIALVLCGSLYAQKDTVYVKDVYESAGQEGTLNDAVKAAVDAGKLSNTVFKLTPYGLYPLTGAIITPSGQTLEIVADAPGNELTSSPPMICWTASTAPDKRYNFDIGGELKMKNIWILYASSDGTRAGSSIRVGDSVSVSGGRCEFDNVIFDYSPISENGSGAVEIYAAHFKGFFRNCYFRNCTDDHFRYYSRALSYRYLSTDLHADSVLFENCTFANMGYVLMQEGAEYGDNVHFNHCTFYNIVMYSLESGWWYKMSVTNSLFVNPFMFGAIPVNDNEGNGGVFAISEVDSFGFTVPFTDQDRRILFSNSNYFYDQWLIDWMGYGPNGNPYSQELHRQRLDDEIPVPMPMLNSDTWVFFDSVDTGGNKVYPYMNAANLTEDIDPGLVNPPLNLDSLKSFLLRKWDDNSDINWAWNVTDWENYFQVWPLGEDLSYTNEALLTAGMGGFPLGDLYRWFPDKYKDWKAQEDTEHDRIYGWLESGEDPLLSIGSLDNNILLDKYQLSQNYPNPFNPETHIGYTIPIAGKVTIKVFNSLGQEVATLFNGEQSPGSHTITFNGADLASGVYLYRMQTGDISITKKFILMK
jgi:hypothetical protein